MVSLSGCFKKLLNSSYNSSTIKVDLPEPLTPTTAVISFIGIFILMSFRLFLLAPMNSIKPLLCLKKENLFFGVISCKGLFKYLAVKLLGLLYNCSSGPEKTISPPSLPALGPRSTIQSQALIISPSCSTTMMVLPSSLSFFNISINLCVSRGCSPTVGSSSTYKVSVIVEPSALLKYTLCISPPDSVFIPLLSVTYGNPTSIR